MQDANTILDLISGIAQQQKVQFSPETATEAEWNEFIASAKRACSSGVNHPTKGAFWRSCQAALPELSRVAADPQLRAELAAAARGRSAAVRAEAQEHLADALDLLCGQGGSITPEEKQMLLDEYILSTDGLLSARDLDDMLARCGITVAAAVSKKAIELLPQPEMARLKSELQVFETDSLFAFLGLRMDAPIATVSTRIDELKQEWSTKRADHRKTAANACLAAAQKYVAVPQMKRRYEVSWAHMRLTENKFIGKVLIAGRDGIIDSAECERLLATAAGLGVMRDLALEVMRVVAATEGFKINEPSKAAPVRQATGSTPAVPQPVAPQPAVPTPGYPAPGPVPQPGSPWPQPGPIDHAGSTDLQAQHRTSAAICYVFPIMSLYLISSRGGEQATDKSGLYFAAYQSLGFGGASLAAFVLTGGMAGLPCALIALFLAAQAYRGVQVKVPVIGEWALKKAA